MGEAETLNSLGALNQKQKRYAEAKELYRRSLEARNARSPHVHARC